MNRYSRYEGILSPEKLRAQEVTVVGVGAIGRQVALQLATVGVGKLDLWDFDTVGEENLGTQGYRPDQVGKSKVDVTKEDLLLINPELVVEIHNQKIGMGSTTADVVAMCVDSIDVRKRFFLRNGELLKLLVDGRMSAETIRVLTSKHGDGNYKDSFFEPGEAFAGSCTTKSTFYSASIAAGLMVAEIAKWLRGYETTADMTVDLLSSDLAVS